VKRASSSCPRLGRYRRTSDVSRLYRILLEVYRQGPVDLLGALFADLSATHLEGRALLLVDDRLLHRFPDTDAFARRIQASEQDYFTSTPAALTTIAENYVGLPYEAVQ